MNKKQRLVAIKDADRNDEIGAVASNAILAQIKEIEFQNGDNLSADDMRFLSKVSKLNADWEIAKRATVVLVADYRAKQNRLQGH